jgi:hypothetical protein
MVAETLVWTREIKPVVIAVKMNLLAFISISPLKVRFNHSLAIIKQNSCKHYLILLFTGIYKYSVFAFS